MDKSKFYKQQDLPYSFDALAPFISKEQLQIHYEKHHAAYVKEANSVLEKLDFARKEGTELDMKATLKSLSFNVGGHILHSLFWPTLTPPDKAKKEPDGLIAQKINNEYGSFERLKSEFSMAAQTVEGAGWAALVFSPETQRPLLMQIEKHNVNIYPGYSILMVLDMFEHAYYIDYKNEKKKWIENFWNIINWDNINQRLEPLVK